MGDDSDSAEDEQSFDPIVDAIKAMHNRPARAAAPDEHPGDQFLSIDADEFSNWLRPREAVTQLGLAWDVATRQLIREAESGRVRTAADSILWTWGSHKGDEAHRLVPTWIWDKSPPAIGDDFWDTGYISAFGPSDAYGFSLDAVPSVKLFDIRFEPIRLQRAAPAPFRPVTRTTPVHLTVEKLPPSASTAPSTAVSTNKGGRPTKDYWEDLVIAMMVLWAQGDLKPKRSADVRKAMEVWLTANDKDWSETPLKERAAKVFQAIQNST